jgi:sterol 14-demethylase
VGLIARGRKRFGDVFSFLLAGKWVHVLTGPEANAAFFHAPEDQFSAKEAYQFTVPIFGRGVAYDTTPEVFDQQLSWLFPALREQRLATYARVMAEETEAYLDSWADGGEIDLLQAMNELTVFIASRCLVGHEFRRRLSAEFAHLYHDLDAGINLVAFFKPHWPLPAMRRRDRARVRVVELVSEIMQERRSQGTHGEDFLETLMETRYADGSPLSDEVVTGMLLTLIFAGQHTSAVLAAWTGILLLANPRYLGPILAEQNEILSDAGEMSLAALKRMPLLDRSIKEAERMYPPLVMLMRTILRDFQFGGFHLPAGSLALVSPAVSHRISSVFAEPDRYQPERYAPPREEDRKTNYALIGFGGGKHRCIGLTFAYQQVKVIWSVLLRRFEFELAGDSPQPDYSTFVVGPRRPCIIRYKRRSPIAVGVPA